MGKCAQHIWGAMKGIGVTGWERRVADYSNRTTAQTIGHGAVCLRNALRECQTITDKLP